MKQEFFSNLPSEIIVHILSRLPVRTIISCKCVCKSWLDLLDSREFAKSHLSKSVPGVIVYRYATRLFKTFKFEEGLERHELHYNPVMEFASGAFVSIPEPVISLEGSADGLRVLNTRPNALYVCNPITREYIKLPSPEGHVHYDSTIVTYGFGVSKLTGQYKVFRILQEFDTTRHPFVIKTKSECQVYTIGTGSWRSVASGAQLEYTCRTLGTFLNGNLHWLAAKGSKWISCLDLETELFSTFFIPPLRESRMHLWGLVALGDCLCLCDNTSDDEIVIWVMKEYGVKKSWTKEIVISKIQVVDGTLSEVDVYPMKVFKDGDILMSCSDLYLVYFCNKTKTFLDIDMLDLKTRLIAEGEDIDVIDAEGEDIDDIDAEGEDIDDIARHIDAMARLHISSFISLKSFDMENVSSF